MEIYYLCKLKFKVMKKPILSEYERYVMNTDTLAGAIYRMNLVVIKLKRTIFRENNAIFKAERYIEHKISNWLSK